MKHLSSGYLARETYVLSWGCSCQQEMNVNVPACELRNTSTTTTNDETIERQDDKSRESRIYVQAKSKPPKSASIPLHANWMLLYKWGARDFPEIFLSISRILNEKCYTYLHFIINQSPLIQCISSQYHMRLHCTVSIHRSMHNMWELIPSCIPRTTNRC